MKLELVKKLNLIHIAQYIILEPDVHNDNDNKIKIMFVSRSNSVGINSAGYFYSIQSIRAFLSESCELPFNVRLTLVMNELFFL